MSLFFLSDYTPMIKPLIVIKNYIENVINIKGLECNFILFLLHYNPQEIERPI